MLVDECELRDCNKQQLLKNNAALYNWYAKHVHTQPTVRYLRCNVLMLSPACCIFPSPPFLISLRPRMATLSTIEAPLRFYHTLGVGSDLRNMPQRSPATAWCSLLRWFVLARRTAPPRLRRFVLGQGVLHFLDCQRNSKGALHFLDCKRSLLRWFVLGPRRTAPPRVASAVLRWFVLAPSCTSSIASAVSFAGFFWSQGALHILDRQGVTDDEIYSQSFSSSLASKRK